MRIHFKTIINLILIVITISYTGIFASYYAIHLLILLLAILLIILNFSHKEGFILSQKAFLPYIFLLFYIIFNGLFNLPKSLFYIIILGTGILVAFRKIALSEITTFFKILKVFSLFLSFSIFLQVLFPDIFYSFAQKWFYYSNQYDISVNLGQISHKYSGLFYEVSFSAFILSIGCIVSFVDSYFATSHRILNFLLAIILFISIVLTGKRSFMLIIPLLLFLSWLFNIFYTSSKTHIFLFLVAFFILLLNIESIYLLITDILTKGEGDTIQLSSRESLWDIAYNMFYDSPFFGKGINSYDVFLNRSGVRSIIYDFAGAHNCYIQILAELGVVGAISYFSVILSTLSIGLMSLRTTYLTQNIEVIKSYNIILISIFMILIYGLSGNVLHQPQQVFLLFILFGFLLNYPRILKSYI